MRSHEELENIFLDWCWDTLDSWLHDYHSWDQITENTSLTNEELEYIADRAILDLSNLGLKKE